MLHIFIHFILVTLAFSLSKYTEDYQVRLPTGRYKGLHDSNTSVTVYYNIPYAYASRFQAPTSIDNESRTSLEREQDATSHGSACPNFNLPPPYDNAFKFLLSATPIKPQSEDCLNFDIYVPDGRHKDLPVLFYIPGGAFLVAASFQYDMRALIHRSTMLGKPFIAVVINYRLGPLGTLNPSTSEDWNVGLLDQMEALRYVNKHVEEFGGDKNKVTIMGQSAGAESALHQILWNDEQLFRAAWFLSIPSTGAPFLQTDSTPKDPLIASFASACGCRPNSTLESNIDCLRTVPVDVMVNASEAWQGSGLGLGGVIKSNIFRAIRSGHFPKIPTVFSTTRDEGTSAAIGFNASNDEVTASVIQNLNVGSRFNSSQSSSFAKNILAAYPNDPSLGCPFDGANITYNQPAQYKRLSAILTDVTYTEAWIEYLRTFSSSFGAEKTWGILFEEGIPGPGVDPALGVQHASDLVYYLPALPGKANDPRKNGLEGLVESVQRGLINFITDLDPNGCDGSANADYWPEFSEEKGERITSFSAKGGVVAIPLPERRGFEVIREGLRPDGF